jgi:hypothetical protein
MKMNSRQSCAAPGARLPVRAGGCSLEGTARQRTIFAGSWNSSLVIMNMGLISAIMALGVNMQWGYAGLFNTGVVGFVALGGLAPVLISTAPVERFGPAAGCASADCRLLVGLGTLIAGRAGLAADHGAARPALIAVLVGGFFVYRACSIPPSPSSRPTIRPPMAISAAWAAGAAVLAGGRRCLPPPRPGASARSRLGCARTIWRLPRWASARSSSRPEERGMAGARGQERLGDPAPGAL